MDVSCLSEVTNQVAVNLGTHTERTKERRTNQGYRQTDKQTDGRVEESTEGGQSCSQLQAPAERGFCNHGGFEKGARRGLVTQGRTSVALMLARQTDGRTDGRGDLSG